jgi:glutathione S-transferase
MISNITHNRSHYSPDSSEEDWISVSYRMVAYFTLSNPSIVLFFVLSSVISAFSPNLERIQPIHHGPTTTLYGGYDATIGANPNTPIQVYCTMKNTDEESRTLICLAELDIINFQIIEIMDPKPDWFLRIHPSGTTPALRNPADTDEIICNSSPEKDEVNEYLCKLYETLSKGPCPLSPSDANDKTRLGDLRTIFYSITKPKCLSYLENEDLDKDDQFRQEMEDALGAFFDENSTETPGSFFLGDAFTLLDADLISSLEPILSILKGSKGYELPRECFPKLTSWLELCNDRASVKSRVDSATKAGLESAGEGSNER